MCSRMQDRNYNLPAPASEVPGFIGMCRHCQHPEDLTYLSHFVCQAPHPQQGHTDSVAVTQFMSIQFFDLSKHCFFSFIKFHDVEYRKKSRRARYGGTHL